MKGLVIRSPWIDRILAGEKTWELRGKKTNIRGRIALIRAGSGQIFATAELIDCLPALSAEELRQTTRFHAVPESQFDMVLTNGWTTPWVLREIIVFPQPISYCHPNGAVTWVQLGDIGQSSALPQTSARYIETDAAPEGDRVSSSGSPTAVLGQEVVDCESWVDIPISAGNIRNNHFYLRSAQRILPSNAIGGPNKTMLATHTIRVRFEPGSSVETDIAGDKMILRARAQVGDFFARSGARPGDSVRLSRQASHSFRVTLMKSSA